MARAGRKAAYSDKRLIDALIRYCDEHEGKITAVDFCRWCGLPSVLERYPDLNPLKGVEPRHFMREVSRYDPVTGKSVKTKSEVRKKIEEVNRLRASRGGGNTLIIGNPKEFLSLPAYEQETRIEKTERLLKEKDRRIRLLESEKAVLTARTEEIDRLEETVGEMREELRRTTEKFRRQITYVMNRINRQGCAEALESRGISADGTDFGKMLEYLENADRKLFSVSEAVQELRRTEREEIKATSKELIEENLNEIDRMLLDD